MALRIDHGPILMAPYCMTARGFGSWRHESRLRASGIWVVESHWCGGFFPPGGIFWRLRARTICAKASKKDLLISEKKYNSSSTDIEKKGKVTCTF